MSEGAPQDELRHPTFAEALRFWLKLGFVSFGGPTGQIAIMHAELVEKRRWIGEERFLHALNYCMLLPGPEAQQLATYAGWLLHGTRGGLAAGVLFVLPSVFVLWGLSWLYVAKGEVPFVAAIFHGLQAAVLAVVFAAVVRIGKKALKNAVMWTLAALSFVSFYFLGAPFPLIIVAAVLIGLAGNRFAREKFLVVKGHAAKGSSPSAVIGDDHAPSHATRTGWRRNARILALGIALWLGPVLAAGAAGGWRGSPYDQGVFFGKAAMVTFGGAYAVLPYVTDQAVNRYEWLGPEQMMAGLGLAETTPGPLIMVVQFVGFLGGWNKPGDLPPLGAATLGALMATWTTFVPCFVYIFLGAPYIERLRGVDSLSCALSAVTAAVVGVVLNLAVWFAAHALFPGGGGIDLFTLAVAAVAFAGMAWKNWNMIAVIAVCAGLGLAWGMAS